jgi:hypothetical protein
MNKSYHFEFPIPFYHPRLPTPMRGIKCTCEPYATIEECVAACKAACTKWGVNYDDREVKLFMTDADGKWEVTEEGELAG